jgi:hypothetical protein
VPSDPGGTINPLLGAYLAAASVIVNGQPDRQWFEASCARSEKSIAFAKEEIERELAEIVRGGYGDHDNLPA